MNERLVYVLKRKFAIALAVIVAATLGAAVFSNRGLRDVYRLKTERDRILAYNRTVEIENAELEEKIRLLTIDKRYIGYIARTELGMIGRDEMLYKIEATEPATPQTRR